LAFNASTHTEGNNSFSGNINALAYPVKVTKILNRNSRNMLLYRLLLLDNSRMLFKVSVYGHLKDSL